MDDRLRRITAALERRGAAGDDRGLSQLAYHAARSVGRDRAPEYLERARAALLFRNERGSRSL